MRCRGAGMGGARSADLRIDLAAPRAVFAELLAGVLGPVLPPPTPVAIRYLVDLLEERVRVPEAPESAIDGPALLAALLVREPDASRLVQLRRLGDAALFVAGFFGQSLARAPFGPLPIRETGRCAYARLSLQLAPLAASRTWSHLYEELADRFRDFADLLAAVGECTRAAPPPLAALYARFLATDSPRDRRRLLGLGALAPELGGLRRLQ